MSELKKILFATDFSRHADDAFKVACSIATMSGGEVVVLHVVPKSLDYEKMCFEECAVQPFPGESKVFEQIDTSYASTCSVPVRPVIKYGSEPERILELAKAEGVDMIVLGARGVGFLEGLMGGGSVADKVARNADIPVLLVP